MLLLLTKYLFTLCSYMGGRTKIVAGDDSSYIEIIVDTPLSFREMTNYESYFTSEMSIVFVRKKNYVPNHPNHMEHEDHLVMMMEHVYTPLSLLEG